MRGEPVENGLGLLARGLMVAGEIGEARVIAQRHAAMALAVPQASLSDHIHLRPACGNGIAHMGNERFATRAAIGAGLVGG